MRSIFRDAISLDISSDRAPPALIGWQIWIRRFEDGAYIIQVEKILQSPFDVSANDMKIAFQAVRVYDAKCGAFFESAKVVHGGAEEALPGIVRVDYPKPRLQIPAFYYSSRELTACDALQGHVENPHTCPFAEFVHLVISKANGYHRVA